MKIFFATPPETRGSPTSKLEEEFMLIDYKYSLLLYVNISLFG